MSAERIHAPDLTSGGPWFNVAAPLTLKALRGKVVLLDFWTYGCINCMHVLPGLRRLEEKYRDELVVVGVHSAKFANERKSENIRRILVRYDIDHPVVERRRFRDLEVLRRARVADARAHRSGRLRRRDGVG